MRRDGEGRKDIGKENRVSRRRKGRAGRKELKQVSSVTPGLLLTHVMGILDVCTFSGYKLLMGTFVSLLTCFEGFSLPLVPFFFIKLPSFLTWL